MWHWVQVDLRTTLRQPTRLLLFRLLRVNGLLARQLLMRDEPRQLCRAENQVSR
jgi:hypothetical protein